MTPHLPTRPASLMTLLALLATALIPAQPALAESRSYKIDPEHASVGFLADHLGLADVLGSFREVAGSFVFDDKAMTVGDIAVTVKTASVYTGHDARDGHLRKKDFLWTDKYPEMTFRSTATERTGDRTGRITGDLMLRGVTRPVTFDVTYNGMRQYPFGPKHWAVGVTAKTTIRRSEFGMTYAVEGGIVGDEVEIIISLEGMRQD